MLYGLMFALPLVGWGMLSAGIPRSLCSQRCFCRRFSLQTRCFRLYCAKRTRFLVYLPPPSECLFTASRKLPVGLRVRCAFNAEHFITGEEVEEFLIDRRLTLAVIVERQGAK